MAQRLPIADRLRRHYTPAANGCWNWTARVDRDDYGSFRITGQSGMVGAHRAAFEAWRGPIPDGHELNHRCRNPRCVNPAHLEPVTRQQHARLNVAANKTHCKHGHAFNQANTYRPPGRPNARLCRACNRAAVARLKARKA